MIKTLVLFNRLKTLRGRDLSEVYSTLLIFLVLKCHLRK